MPDQMIPIKEQAREGARYAWEKVNSVKASQLEEYATMAKKLPAMINSNGLGQTLAFLFSKIDKKSENANQQGFNHLIEWLKKLFVWSEDPYELLKKVIELEPSDYRVATREAIELASWLKRFSTGKAELMATPVGGEDEKKEF